MIKLLRRLRQEALDRAERERLKPLQHWLRSAYKGMFCPRCHRSTHNCGLGVMGCGTCQLFIEEAHYAGGERLFRYAKGWHITPSEEKPAPITLFSTWEPGSSAFWLDPDLWTRSPMKHGRHEPCWMHIPPPPSPPPPPPRKRDYILVAREQMEVSPQGVTRWFVGTALRRVRRIDGKVLEYDPPIERCPECQSYHRDPGRCRTSTYRAVMGLSSTGQASYHG